MRAALQQQHTRAAASYFHKSPDGVANAKCACKVCCGLGQHVPHHQCPPPMSKTDAVTTKLQQVLTLPRYRTSWDSGTQTTFLKCIRIKHSITRRATTAERSTRSQPRAELERSTHHTAQHGAHACSAGSPTATAVPQPDHDDRQSPQSQPHRCVTPFSAADIMYNACPGTSGEKKRE